MEEKPEGGVYKLRIPNEEVKEVYRTQISDWFKETIQENASVSQLKLFHDPPMFAEKIARPV